VAILELFVDPGFLDARLAGAFLQSMQLRETADYGSDFSDDGAAVVIEIARELLNKAEHILSSK
jgi:uncharacterized protein (UPF0332 family)